MTVMEAEFWAWNEKTKQQEVVRRVPLTPDLKIDWYKIEKWGCRLITFR